MNSVAAKRPFTALTTSSVTRCDLPATAAYYCSCSADRCPTARRPRHADAVHRRATADVLATIRPYFCNYLRCVSSTIGVSCFVRFFECDAVMHFFQLIRRVKRSIKNTLL